MAPNGVVLLHGNLTITKKAPFSKLKLDLAPGDFYINRFEFECIILGLQIKNTET